MTPEINAPGLGQNGQKTRILFVITQSELGGAQQFLAQLLSQLDPRAFTWTVVVGADGQNELQHLLPPETDYCVVSHLKRNPSIWSDLVSLRELRAIYRHERPDVIFLMSSKAGFNGAVAAWGLPTRIIYRIGGWAFNDPRPAWQRFFIRIMEKVSARWKDDIVVNNQKDFDDAQRLGIHPRGKVHLIHNGIDPYRQLLDRMVARQKLEQHLNRPDFLQDKKIVGTIANFYPAKGLSGLIATARQVPDAVFVIIGEGALRPGLERQIAENNLRERVFLTGRIPHAADYLPAFDLFVLPSQKEGFPWALLEAMVAKVAVIATAVGAVPEIIENGVNGIIVPAGDPDQIARAITTLLNDERRRQAFAMQAHQTILKRFSLHTMVERYRALFTKRGTAQ